MTIKDYQYLYGPVYSWRLGLSLGIDPLSLPQKVCNMDCVYCQLGKTSYWAKGRHVYVPTQALELEVKTLSPTMPIDCITFSGRGEPTLAKNLGEMIQLVRRLRPEKIAVLTNSSLLHLKEVREDLSLADYVLMKLDVLCQKSFECVDHPQSHLKLSKVISGILEFKKVFAGRFAIQIMVIQENLNEMEKIADFLKEIRPEEVQLNTPLRASAAAPISKQDMQEVKLLFAGLPVISVYDVQVPAMEPWNFKQTAARHGQFLVAASQK